MELRHLRYFAAVAEAENVSRAALQLRVSQPALSRQIRDLEDELGFALLKRTAKSVSLTEAGRVFLAESRAVLERAEMAVKTARAAASGQSGVIQAGYAPTLAARILPTALQAFKVEFPGVLVKLHDLSTEEMLAGLREGRLHLAFMVRPAPGAMRGLKREDLLREPLRLAVPLNHRFAGRRSVSIADAAREDFVSYNRRDYPDYHELLASVFASADRPLRIVDEHDGVSSLISAVVAGAGVALTLEALGGAAALPLKLIPLTPAPAPLIIAALWNPKTTTPFAKEFLRCAKDTASNMRKPSLVS